MADENETKTKPEPSVRKKIQMERMAMVARGRVIDRVRVVPRDDEVRAAIKHPRAGRFRSSGSMEWPNDTFTRRRVRDGTVTIEERDKPTNGQKPSHHRRSHADEAAA